MWLRYLTRVGSSANPSQEITLSDAQTLLAELNTVSASLQAEIDEWKAKIAGITAQNEQLFDETAQLKVQKDRAFAEVDEAERVAMKKDLRLEEYGEWWVCKMGSRF